MGVRAWSGVHCVLLPQAGLATQLLYQSLGESQGWGVGTDQRSERRTHLWRLGLKLEELGQDWGPLGSINYRQRTAMKALE